MINKMRFFTCFTQMLKKLDSGGAGCGGGMFSYVFTALNFCKEEVLYIFLLYIECGGLLKISV